MFNKPFPIAATITLLTCIPLYVLSSQDFVLTTQHLPLFALSQFVAILIAVFLSRMPSYSQRREQPYSAPGTPRETGNVKWFNSSKGFGFITRDSGDDIFVHFRSIRGQGHRVLHDGQRVEFVVSEGDKGLQAEDVAAAK